jgi:membrane-bound ClpP family serine protease
VSSASASGGASSGRRPITIVIAVIGVIAVIVGLMYLFAGNSLPSFMVTGSHVHKGNHLIRGLVALVVGLVLVFAAWRAGRSKSGAASRA